MSTFQEIIKDLQAEIATQGKSIAWGRITALGDEQTVYDFDNTIDFEAAVTYDEEKSFSFRGVVVLSDGSWLDLEEKPYPADDCYEWYHRVLPTKPDDWS